MSCKHNLFLNSNYEEQDTDRIEIDQALFRIKEAVKKSENKTNEAQRTKPTKPSTVK